MKQSITTVAALAMAVTGITFTASAQNADNAAERAAQRTENQLDRTNDRVGQRADEAGRDLNRNMNETRRDANRTMAPNGTAQAPDAEGIKDVLAQVPESVLTEDGFDDLVERFVDADRNRIGEFIKQNDKNFDTLNAKAKTLVDKFKAKYNVDEFDLENEDQVFNQQFASITQSEIGDAARTAGAREGGEVKVETRTETRTGDRDAGDAMRDAGAKVGDAARDVGAAAKDATANTGVDSPDTTAADANRNDPGRNIATVKINKSHGMPELTVDMIHEFPGVWKIDVPDQVTGQQLYDNLGKSLDQLAKDESKWPADKNEAYRYLTHSLLMSIHGKDAGTGAGAGGM